MEFDEEEELFLMVYVDLSNVEGKGVWFLDFGCFNYMIGEKLWFYELDEGFKYLVRLGNGVKMMV